MIFNSILDHSGTSWLQALLLPEMELDEKKHIKFLNNQVWSDSPIVGLSLLPSSNIQTKVRYAGPNERQRDKKE